MIYDGIVIGAGPGGYACEKEWNRDRERESTCRVTQRGEGGKRKN